MTVVEASVARASGADGSGEPGERLETGLPYTR